MAFTSEFVPGTIIEEAQDGMGFTIKDDSVWGTGDQATTTTADITIVYIDEDDVETTYDDITMIVGGTRTDFNSYLTASGLVIDIADLTIDGVAAPEVFPDGYYEITVTYTPAAGDAKTYKNTQAFLAKYRAMKRTMPALLLEWPLTATVKEKNYDIFALGLYLDAAEYAADLARKEHYRKFIGVIDEVLDFYEIPQPW